MLNWLRNLILKWLGIDKLDARLYTVEKHFVTRRDQAGGVVETLADVPLDKRKELKPKRAGMSPQQYLRYLEATDGGTRAPREERLPSIT